MDLNAHPYRCFLAVAETLSFRRAASRLNVSQPSLSAQIRELERRLGFDLFVRSSRSVAITSEGKLFLPNARRLVLETDIINRAAFDIRTDQVRLGSPLYTALIPERVELIDRVMRQNAALKLRVLNEEHARALAALRAQELDLVITLLPDGPGAASDVPPEMEWSVLARREMKILLPAEHPIADQAVMPLDALRKVKVARISRIHGRGMSDLIAARLADIGAEPVRSPEGNAIAVEQYARASGIAAIALDWIPAEPSAATDWVLRSVEGLDLFSCLVIVRNRAGGRPAVDSVWNACLAISQSMSPSYNKDLSDPQSARRSAGT